MEGLKGRLKVREKRDAEFILQSQANLFPGGNKGFFKSLGGDRREPWVRNQVQMDMNG